MCRKRLLSLIGKQRGILRNRLSEFKLMAINETSMIRQKRDFKFINTFNKIRERNVDQEVEICLASRFI